MRNTSSWSRVQWIRVVEVWECNADGRHYWQLRCRRSLFHTLPQCCMRPFSPCPRPAVSPSAHRSCTTGLARHRAARHTLSSSAATKKQVLRWKLHRSALDLATRCASSLFAADRAASPSSWPALGQARLTRAAVTVVQKASVSLSSLVNAARSRASTIDCHRLPLRTPTSRQVSCPEHFLHRNRAVGLPHELCRAAVDPEEIAWVWLTYIIAGPPKLPQARR